MTIAIGSTRAGLTLTDALTAHLRHRGEQVDNLGMQAEGPFIPYHEVAARIAAAVSAGEYPRAIIICGTGAGSAIVANKFKGVYAVQASTIYEGRRATIVNNANVLTLGEWTTPPQHACEIVDAWLAASFTEGFAPEWQTFLTGAYEAVQAIEDAQLR